MSTARTRRRSTFATLGWLIAAHPRLVIGCWILLVLVAAPFLSHIEEPLKVGGFSSSKTEAARARQVMRDELNASEAQLVIVFVKPDGGIDDPAQLDLIAGAINGFRGKPHIDNIVLPSENRSMISPDGTTAYALVGLDQSAEIAQRNIADFESWLGPTPGLQATIAGGPAFYADIETVSQRDLQRAELIAFPFALIALLLVFGTLVAALVPLIVGGMGVATILLVIYGVAHITDLSIFVLNLATMLGLGLAIDYSLFVTSRFREELQRGDDVPTALARTMATAGRAVFFSGLTVLIGLGALVTFDFMFLRSVGIAGIIVVGISLLAALTLLPAILVIIGRRIERFRLFRIPGDNLSHHGFWSILSRWVMARPVLVLVPTLLVLIVLGEPFRHVNISSPDATILPAHTTSRQGYDQLVTAFGPGEISPMVLVFQSPTSMFADENALAIRKIVRTLEEDPRVSRADGFMAFGAGTDDDQALGLLKVQERAMALGFAGRFAQFAQPNTALVLVYLTTFPNDPASKAILRDIRANQPGGDVTLLVDGGTAEIVDVVAEMYGNFPLAIGIVVIATYLILFLLFHSVILPIKAILMNMLSLIASYGALVWIFQDGHLANLLRFQPQGYVEASLPIIMFCILFGLSMDYEVFLLSRVREEWERTHDNTEAVAIGLQRSGRIITSAALIVVVVTISFISADVILVKALGFGIALAVFLDATVVRALLVPATMRLLGNANWWVPGFLQRFSISHEEHL